MERGILGFIFASRGRAMAIDTHEALVFFSWEIKLIIFVMDLKEQSLLQSAESWHPVCRETGQSLHLTVTSKVSVPGDSCSPQTTKVTLSWRTVSLEPQPLVFVSHAA